MFFYLVLNWYNYDSDFRKKIVKFVFEKIRFVVDGWFILYFVIYLELFKLLFEFKNLIDFVDFCLINYYIRFLINDLMIRVRYFKKFLI